MLLEPGFSVLLESCDLDFSVNRFMFESFLNVSLLEGSNEDFSFLSILFLLF